MANKKKPSEKRKLEGNRSRTKIPTEAELDYMAPECPDWLGEDARKIWDRKAPPLIQIKVLSALNEDEFAEYCNLVITLRRINKFIDSDNPAMTQITEYPDYKEGGTKMKIDESPYSKMRRLYQTQLERYAKIFKLRPQDMAGLYRFKEENSEKSHLLT